MQAMAALPGFFTTRHSWMMGMSSRADRVYRASSTYSTPARLRAYTISTPAAPPMRVPTIRLTEDSMVLPAEFCTHTTAAIME